MGGDKSLVLLGCPVELLVLVGGVGRAPSNAAFEASAVSARDDAPLHEPPADFELVVPSSLFLPFLEDISA